MSGKPEIDQKDAGELMLAGELLKSVGSLTDRISDMAEKHAERIALLEENMAPFKGVEIGGVMEKLQALDEGMKSIRKQIKGNRHSGLWVPGLEDEPDGKFSMVKACIGVKAGGTQESFEKYEAGYEWKVIEAAREAAAKSGHVTGIDSAGGYFVPDQVIADIIQAIYTRSVLIDLAGTGQTRCSVLDGLTGNPIKIPKFEGGMIAYWIGEEDDYVESRSKVGNVTMGPKKMGVLTKITDEMRRFAGFGFDQLFRNDMIRAAAKKMDHTVMYGTGTEDMPRGLANMAEIQVYDAAGNTGYDGLAAARSGVADWAESEMDFDDLDEMRGIVEDNDIDVEEDDFGSWAYISAPRFWRRLRRTKVSNYSGQTAEKAYLLGAPIIRDETLRGLIGDFDRTTQIGTTKVPGASISGTTTETNEKCTDVFAANWNEVVIGRWSGIEIEDDAGRGTGFVKDETQVKLRLYADVGHRQPKSIVLCPNAQVRD